MDIDGNTPTDIVEVLEYKADILRDKYRAVTNGREIMLEAAQNIRSLRTKVEELEAEVARLSQVAKY
jgi:ubiquinone biosynthesis protein UbiJ